MTIKYESEDKRIRVEEQDGQKAMFVDGVIQGVCDLEGNPLSPYMVFVKKHLDGLAPGSLCTFLGGGAFILPRYAKKLGHEIDVFETDATVIHAANNFFGQLNYVPHNYDAMFFDEKQYKQADFIFLDCYDNGFPEKLYCPEFIARCERACAPKGVFACNYGGTALEIEAFGKMLATVFPNVKVNLIAMDPDYKGSIQGVFFCN